MSGDTDANLMSGQDDVLAGEDLGFLPLLAAAGAPALIARFAPMALSALRSGGAAKLASAARGGHAKGLASKIRMPKGMAQRAMQSMAEGKSPQEAFMSAFADSQQTAGDEAAMLGALNPNNPLTKILQYVRNILPGSDDATKSAVKSVATSVTAQAVLPKITNTKPVGQPMPRSSGGSGLARIANPTTPTGAGVVYPSGTQVSPMPNLPPNPYTTTSSSQSFIHGIVLLRWVIIPGTSGATTARLTTTRSKRLRGRCSCIRIGR